MTWDGRHEPAAESTDLEPIRRESPADWIRNAMAATGAVPGGAVPPNLVAPLGAVRDPEFLLHVDTVTDRGRRLRGRGWAAQGAGMITLNAPGGDLDIRPAEPGFLPVALARLVGLGPRPRLDFAPLEVSRADLDDVFGIHPRKRAALVRAAAGERLAEPATKAAASALARGPWTLATLRAEWPGPDGTAARRTVRIWDFTAGIALVDPVPGHPDTVVIRPSEASTAYLRLAQLLPTDGERLDTSRFRLR